MWNEMESVKSYNLYNGLLQLVTHWVNDRHGGDDDYYYDGHGGTVYYIHAKSPQTPPSNVKNSHQLSQSFPTIGVLIRITMRQEKSSLSQHVVNNDNFSNECIFISDHIQYEILPAICNPQSRRCQHMISDNALLHAGTHWDGDVARQPGEEDDWCSCWLSWWW